MAETAYIRTTDGDTRDLPVDEAVLRWLDVDGYRITIKVGSYEFILRRAEGLHTDDPLGNPSFEAVNVVIRGGT